METLKTVKHVRDTISSLNECRDFVINKQKRAEIERLVLELQMLEESLLAKNPLLLSGLGPLASSSGSALIGSAQTLQQFKVYVDQQKGSLLSLPTLQQEAANRGLDPQQAVNSVQQMQQQEQRIQAEAMASHMLPEVRSAVYGQQVTERQLIELVKRKVQGNLTVPASLVDPVTVLIVQQLKLESGQV